MIHPTAIVHARARVDDSAIVGPYSVIEQDVEIGPDCVIGPNCHFTGTTRVGRGNRFHAGCVIGDAPQDLKYADAPTGVRIGDANVFREHVTVHRSNTPDENTVVGSHNLFMVASHVGHNSIVGSRVILANSAVLGGHAVVEDQAFISGNCSVHQFVRVGTLSMMQGNSAVSLDLPPFTMVYSVNALCGLNIVGLRRAGLTPEQRLELKRVYKVLFRSGLPLSQAFDQAGSFDDDSPATRLLAFVRSSSRGVCRHVSRARADS